MLLATQGLFLHKDILYKPGVSNSWASGGHIACWQSCRGPHDVFDSEIITSPGNGLCNATGSEVDLQKKGHYHSSISTPWPFFRRRYSEIEFCGTKWSLYLSSVASVKGFKRFLQYCRNSIRILESSHGSH